jgi:UDP-2,4-diacetamido-2,4,6-trideoxy-beta-L-altropyranose hydrolase
MRFLFRADASVALGSGHIIRCATLAQGLVAAGHTLEFVCRDQPGDLNDWLVVQGFVVRRLRDREDTEREDADACRAAICGQRFDWVVVDHHGLASEWEAAMAGVAYHVAAIDDLGRMHDCDLLLDQNYPTKLHRNYLESLPKRCERLLGPQFALLRPDFAALRPAALPRHRQSIARLLVFMSGSDPCNETTKALTGLVELDWPVAVDVVVGAGNPHRASVERACARLANATLHVQTSRMAELMATADLMIGAGGNASWERCALGLPAIVTILAENQVQPAEALAAVGAHRLLGWHHNVSTSDYARALAEFDGPTLGAMSGAAAAICDGAGLQRVIARLMASHNDRAAFG